MAQDRETRVPVNLLDGEAHFTGEDGIAEALVAADTVLRYVGGTVQLAAVREPIAPDAAPEAFVTVELIFRWNPYTLKRPVVDMDTDVIEETVGAEA